MDNLERFLLTSPLGVPSCSNHIMDIELNTNTWGFKCAFTCTHSIVGWDLSLPYHRTSIASRRSQFTVTYALCRKFAVILLYLYIIVTENTNGNSPWWLIQWPIWGKVGHTHASLLQCVIDININWLQISTEQVFQQPQLLGLNGEAPPFQPHVDQSICKELWGNHMLLCFRL
jgi:hypothetical protein